MSPLQVIERPYAGPLHLFLPDFSIELAGEGVEWPVCKPFDLSDTKGVNITLDRLEEMAAAYDPEQVEAAAVNIDHERSGPALGWIADFFIRDGMLWARPVDLADDLAAGIRAKKYRRQSLELVTQHPVTGGWYPNGLAVLGAKRSAVKGLPPITLSERKVFLIRLADPGPAGQPETAPDPAQAEEVTMTTPQDPKQPAAGAAPSAPATPPAQPAAPAQSATAAAEATLAEATTRLQTKTTELDAAIARANAAERAAIRRQVELAVDRVLAGGLGKRVTPGMVKAGVRQLLIELQAAESPLEVTLADGDKQKKVSAYDVLLAVLKAVPEFTALGDGQLAGEEHDAAAPRAEDDRPAEIRQLHQQHGLSDERIAELRNKRGMVM